MPKKIEYGTKSMKIQQRDIGIKPIFFLVKENNEFDNKCYCSACQNVFNWDAPEDDEKLSNSWNTQSQISRFAENVGACPDPNCGNDSAFSYVKASTENVKQGHINMKGSYAIPNIVTGRYLFTYTDDNGNVNRIDDNLMLHSTIVYPSGKTFQFDTEYSLTDDLVKNTQLMTKTRITGEKREELNIKDTVDTFRYMPVNKSFSITGAYDINTVHFVGRFSPDYMTMYNPIADNEIIKNINPYSQTVLVVNEEQFPNSHVDSIFKYHETQGSEKTPELSEDIAKLKSYYIMSRFKDIDPVYKDTFNNGLYLSEHHPGSNEDNTQVDEKLRLMYTYMMTKYPVAFEYACERADLQCLNWTMNEKRRTEANPNYQAKDIPNSVKSKFLRNEVEFISQQLASVDDKILDTVKSSKNVEDMKQKLQFFVFGQNDKVADTQVPKQIRLTENQTMQNPIDATKKLKKAFGNNMIGVASTVYTCHKLGIKDINYVNTVIDIANGSPSLQPERHRKNGQYTYDKPKREPHRHAGTIVPIRDNTMLRFLRNYGNTHSTTDLIDSVYGSTDKYRRATENVRIYADILKHADVASTHDEINQNTWDLEKARLTDYLRNKSIQYAYVDYIGMYGENTPKKVNFMAYQIKQDKMLLAMKKEYTANGLDGIKANPAFSEAIAKFPPYMDSSDESKAAFAANPDAYMTAFFDKYKPVKIKETVVAQNGKSLFNNRSMDELHDELSHMSKNCKYPNTEIEYSEKDKALEAEYEAPDESGIWSFGLHENTNEMIRTATELSNCLASHQDYAIRGHRKYLFMKNELGEKVACISLSKSGNSYKVDEFQAAHDNAVDGRYKEVIHQWLDEHEIDYHGNDNVAAIGTDKSFYGGADADYHHDEVDEVTGTVVSIAENKQRAQERHEKAVALYGLKDDGSLNLPDVPQELC